MEYTIEELTKDFSTALGNSCVGPYSKRYIGDPAKLKMWTADKYAELYNGLASAYALFYSDIGIPFKEFAQVVMCECLQESTGNYNLWVGPVMMNDGDAHGLIQATPQSVLLDYHVWGQQMVDVSGSVIVRPHEVLQWDLSHCTLNLMMWGWYTRNTLGAGMSLNELGFVEWHRRSNDIVRDFGNALYIWLGGPENYRQDAKKIKESPGHLDYYLRVKDYYVCNMGTAKDFERIFNTRVPRKQIAINVPKMNISMSALNDIRRLQGQGPLNGHRPLTLEHIMGQRTVLYGIDKIGSFGYDLPRTKNKHNRYPYNMTEEQVKRYKETVYPAWNASRMRSGRREVRGDKLEWVVDGVVYKL